MSTHSTPLHIDDLIHRKQEAIACPYPIFANLRATDGVQFNADLGAWIITRYDDVRAILRDTDRFSSLSPTGPQAAGEALMNGIMQLMQDPEMAALLGSQTMTRGRVAVLLNADPPDHRRQRKLVNPAFRPDRIRAMEPAITSVALELLANVKTELEAHGQTDILSTFTVGLPMTIIAMALGVAGEDLATFKRWSDDIVMPVGNHSPSVEQVKGFLISTKEFTEYFLAQIAQRKRQPTGDLLCDVANAQIDGEELTDDEQLGMLQQFLVAGNETTTNLISNMIRHLAENSEVQSRIRRQPELIEAFVEEMLRSEAPVGGLFRQAKVEVVVAGTTIPAGDHLWLVFASANRDECKFSDPDSVDPDRANVKEHLAFGNGEHFCPGAGLARSEARIAIQLVLEHLDDIQLTAENDFPYGDSFVLRGLTSLKITARPKV